MARLSRPAFFIPVCIALGLAFDQLFWDQRWGFSFTLFISLLLAAGLWLAAQLRLHAARRSWPLALAAFGFAAVSSFLTEEYTLLFTRGFALLLLLLFAADFLAGDWLNYRFSDFAVKLASLLPAGWLASAELKPAARRGKAVPRPWAAWLRGVLLALPVVFVLGALLASADSYFAEGLQQTFSFLRIERLPEYLFRLVLVGLVAILVYGAYHYAFLRSQHGAAKTGPLKPFIGFTEAGVVLASVALLLAAFVVVQFRYFFGGAENVLGSLSTATYAEYARRGFAELCLVAALVLALFVLLSSLTRRSTRQQGYFSALGVLLLALIAVVLVSAFQRLQLYEAAYGFTSMRLLPHLFMIWLGLLLLALVILELSGRQRWFAATVLLAACGFVASLPVVNLDAFTTRANIAHGLQADSSSTRHAVDYAHLAGLSPDALPALVEGYYTQRAAGNQALADQLAVAIACNAYFEDGYGQSWREWTLSRQRAAAAWQQVSAEPGFPSVFARQSDGQVLAQQAGQTFSCYAP
ncbi:MAG: DUF4173 domain-containing protein [Anaerolineales bacterium]|nr:DUF4173 domain-containing protein [Anaerolineales bacterium]